MGKYGGFFLGKIGNWIYYLLQLSTLNCLKFEERASQGSAPVRQARWGLAGR